MEFRVINSITQTDKALWDSIVKPDHVICTYDYLWAIEGSGINDCDYRYVMVYDGDKLIAHTCIYSMSFELDIFNLGSTKKIIDFIRKRFNKNFMMMRVIECGTPTALGNTVTILDGVDYNKVLKLIIKAMENYAKERNIKILILRDFYEEDIFMFDNLKKMSFKRVNVLPNSIFINNWNNFDEFLDDLRSRYRYRIHKFLKHLESQHIKVEIREHFADLAEELTKLWFNIYSHAKEYKREVLTPQYFRNMDTFLKEKSKIILFKVGEKIIAFDFVIIDDHTLRPLFVGMDYSYNEEGKLYFNILCQSIKMGIDEKKKVVEMGITTIEPKKEMGSIALPSFAYMRHLTPILNFIVTNLYVLLSPPFREKSLHVFNKRFYGRIYTNYQIRFIYKDKICYAALKDINMKGARIESDVNIKKNDILTVEFVLESNYNTFSLKTRVVWVKKMEKNNVFGVEFIFVKYFEEEYLANFIEYLKVNSSSESEIKDI